MILVIGSNTTSNHPVAATWMKNAAAAGAILIVCDPRRSDLGRHASHYLQFKPDTDVALLNAMLNVIVEEDLVDKQFIEQRTSNFEALRRNVKGYSPEIMAPVCGIPAETIRQIARLYATSKASMIFWGMGISPADRSADPELACIRCAVRTTYRGPLMPG